MLSFLVYEQGALRAKWPANIDSLAYPTYLADAWLRPQEKSCDFDYGRLTAYCPPGLQRRLVTRYAVPGFGDPILYTPVLLSGERQYILAVELAAGRMETIEKTLDLMAADGIMPSPPLHASIKQARALTRQAREMTGNNAAASTLADEALAISVPAGEAMALEVANIQLAERKAAGGLRDVLFGCTGFGFQQQPEKRQHYFQQAFNYATMPFYLNGMEPEPGHVLHEPVLQAMQALREHGVNKFKGHPLVWTYTPCLRPDLYGMDFNTCREVFRQRIRRDVPPFRDLIDYWDIINEANSLPWANSLGFSNRQMIELTAMAARETRALAPKSKLVINICLAFGEYTAGAPGRVTPLEYFKSCIAAGIDFDVIGLQFYFGQGGMQYCWDMLEISRLLDQYVALGKEIHLTELGVPSQNGPDPNAMIDKDNEVGFWHNGWNETTQADWLEQFYRLCLSKPNITALTWWDFSSASRIFWPHAGLLNKDDEPKEAYHRLCALRKEINSPEM